MAIAAGGDHSLALKNDGTVWAWGQNAEASWATAPPPTAATPVQVSSLSGVTAVAAGGHSLARQDDGTVWAWG